MESTESLNNMSAGGMFLKANVVQRLPGKGHEDYYSDEVDSDVEERLYSLIHHAQSDSISIDKGSGSCKRKDLGYDGPEDVTASSSGLNRNKKSSLEVPSADSSGIKRACDTSKAKVASSKGECTEIIDISDSDGEDSASTSHRSLWHVDLQDIMVKNPNPRISSLYQSRKFCSRCRRVGNHPVKLCHLREEKICHICGAIGHFSETCQNLICFKCHGYHRPNKCLYNWRKIFCDECKTHGHCSSLCTTHWRKYFNTTDPSASPNVITNKMIVNKKKSCSQCGQKHFASECEKFTVGRPDLKINFSSTVMPIKSNSLKRKKPSPSITSSSSSQYFSRKNNKKTKQNPGPVQYFSPSAFVFTSNDYKLTRKERKRISNLKYQHNYFQNNKSKKI